MKFSLKNKFLLSYTAVIVFTLAALETVIRFQMERHFQVLVEQIHDDRLPFPITIEKFRPGMDFLHVMQNSTLYAMMGGLALAFILSLLVTRSITRPIEAVIAATQDIAKGNYAKRVEAQSNDEIGDLGTALNQMAESLQNNQYLQRKLLTNVTHELATPLTNLEGYLEALSDKVIRKEPEKTYKLMQEETARLKNMIDEVRSLSVVQEPQFKVHPVAVKIDEETQKILEGMRSKFEKAKVKLVCDQGLGNAIVMLDPQRYAQILINLLNNALQASKPNSTILLNFCKDKKSWFFDVIDEGHGIPEKDLPFIFERFYRADDSRNRKTGGLGVGLTIVKELVTAHGGKISVTSKEGKGTAFHCEFPLLKLSKTQSQKSAKSE